MFTYFTDIIFSKFNNSWERSKSFALRQKSSASKSPRLRYNLCYDKAINQSSYQLIFFQQLLHLMPLLQDMKEQT